MNGTMAPTEANNVGDVSRLRLADGRTLAYAEYGDPSGQPVLFFHGIPSSRLMHPDADISKQLGVRLIAPDRPGFGRSDPKPGRTLLDWTYDVEALADSLSLGQFTVVGPSGGGPFVAACAARLSSRIKRAAIVGGSGPVDAPSALAGAAFERRAGYWLARHAPMLLRLAIRMRPDPHRDPERFFDSYTRHNPPCDQELFRRPEIRAMFLASYREATRQGRSAFTHELELVANSWGFSLGDIDVPMTIWQGTADNMTPVGMGRALAEAIPRANLRLVPNEGHLIFLSHWREIAEDLIAKTEMSPSRNQKSLKW
jgi:pimeloyl-ACP methyl ester carboxylesterase